jgi:hypothetical protein
MEAYCKTCALDFEQYRSFSLHKAKNRRHKEFTAAKIRMTKLDEYLDELQIPPHSFSIESEEEKGSTLKINNW